MTLLELCVTLNETWGAEYMESLTPYIRMVISAFNDPSQWAPSDAWYGDSAWNTIRLAESMYLIHQEMRSNP